MGREHRSLRLLADKMVDIEYVERVSYETVRHTLKNELEPWLKQQRYTVPEANGQFVWHMEDVLSVYTRPYDARYPQVYMDETNKQLLRNTRPSLPMKSGNPNERMESMSAMVLATFFSLVNQMIFATEDQIGIMMFNSFGSRSKLVKGHLYYKTPFSYS